MFWHNKKKKPDVVVIQEILQDQNDVFDIAIIALERLESLLLAQKNVECTLKATAMGTDRDFHQNQRTLYGAFKELLMQCSSLSMCSAYDDKEIFEIAVQLFVKNLFEWYAGRNDLGFFDEVDSAVIPILYSLMAKDMDEITSVFEKFVYKAPNNDALSLNEKYEKTRAGVTAWILAQERLKELQKETESKMGNNSEIIRSHCRGDVITGYLHVMKAMMTMFYVSGPAKLVYNMVQQYLPELVKSVPHINETYIDEWFERKIQEDANNKNSDEVILNSFFAEDGVTYIRLRCSNPIDLSSPRILWKHGDNNCNGDIYLGDNGFLYCEKCRKQIGLVNAIFKTNGTISFDEGNGKITNTIKTFGAALCTSDQMVEDAGLDWLHRVLESLKPFYNSSAEVLAIKNKYDKEVMLPILQDAVKRILDNGNIEYNKIVIDIK